MLHGESRSSRMAAGADGQRRDEEIRAAGFATARTEDEKGTIPAVRREHRRGRRGVGPRGIS